MTSLEVELMETGEFPCVGSINAVLMTSLEVELMETLLFGFVSRKSKLMTSLEVELMETRV